VKISQKVFRGEGEATFLTRTVDVHVCRYRRDNTVHSRKLCECRLDEIDLLKYTLGNIWHSVTRYCVTEPSLYPSLVAARCDSLLTSLGIKWRSASINNDTAIAQFRASAAVLYQHAIDTLSHYINSVYSTVKTLHCLLDALLHASMRNLYIASKSSAILFKPL